MLPLCSASIRLIPGKNVADLRFVGDVGGERHHAAGGGYPLQMGQRRLRGLLAHAQNSHIGAQLAKRQSQLQPDAGCAAGNHDAFARYAEKRFQSILHDQGPPLCQSCGMFMSKALDKVNQEPSSA